MPYSTRFFLGEYASGNTTAYTVPSGFVAVVRDIEAYNALGASSGFVVDLVTPTPTTGVIWRIGTFDVDTWAQWHGRTVANAGDELVVNGGSGSLFMICSGYLLTSP